MVIPRLFEIRDRGPTPRGFKKAFNEASKVAWYLTGQRYHDEYTDKRFTQAHATLAGYTPRSKKYTLRKFKEKGHTRPLEYSGDTRAAVSRPGRIAATREGVAVRYAGARTFNFRNPKSTINMVQEFTKVLEPEAQDLARYFDKQLDDSINK